MAIRGQDARSPRPPARCRRSLTLSLPLIAAAVAPVKRDLHLRRYEERSKAETTPVPLLTLFALNALLDSEALNSNNVRGGTCLAESGGAKKSA